jgi:AcrR family transcriptional regulator
MRGPAEPPRTPHAATGPGLAGAPAGSSARRAQTQDTPAQPIEARRSGKGSARDLLAGPGRRGGPASEGSAQHTLEALWLRPERAGRAPALTREAIVATAVALADDEGIDAVSIRRVAGLLGVRPMSLYSHVGRKQDLLALMVDEAVRACLVPGELPEDWREALFLVARHTRDGARRHPWMLAAAAEKVAISPNSLRHFEQCLAALSSLETDREQKLAILVAVDTYTIGQVARELAKLKAPRPGGDEGCASPLRAAKEYLSRVLERGDLPHLAEFGLDAAIDASEAETEAADRRFTVGLGWLLDGIAASLAADRS